MVFCLRFGHMGPQSREETMNNCHVSVVEGLRELREDAAAARTDAEKKSNMYEMAVATAKVSLIDALVPFTCPTKQCIKARWDQFAVMIQEAVTIPYPQFIPMHKSNLAAILLHIDK